MATVTPQFASPVDYEAYGVYGPKGMSGADRTFVRPRYPVPGPGKRGRLGRVPGRAGAATTSTSRSAARGRTGRRSSEG
jgi:hypothetical protein